MSEFSPLELSASAPTFSSSTSSSSQPSTRRLSISSFRGSTPIRRRGQAPSSFIHFEASPSITLSPSSRQNQTIFSSQRQPEPRETSIRLGRISIVATPRSKTSRPASIISTTSTGSNYDRSRNLWSQQSILKRMSWGWNQTFAGLTPDQLTEVEIQRARPKQIDIPKRVPIERKLSSSASEHSATRSFSDSKPPSEPTVNRPFASRRPSTLRPTRPELELPPVVEEAIEEDPPVLPELEQDQEYDEMGLRRAFSNRFLRSSSPALPKQRPQISLPALISTTNAQLNDSLDVHPALRNSSSSNEYNTSSGSTTPSSPVIDETPGLTDSSSFGSSGGSSRSSAHGSPTVDRSPTTERFSVEPNHLTQYFPQLAPEKVADNVTIVTDDVFATAPPALPKRAASHSKHEHERLARTRSMRSSGGISRTSINTNGSTQIMHREPIGRALTAPSSRHASLENRADQPFASELAQVDEIHEDFASLVLEEQRTNDEVLMKGQGYRTLTPSVYMMDLADMEASRWD